MAASGIFAVLLAAQIFFLNWGSQFTPGGRASLIIFSYPLLVPLVTPAFLRNESLKPKTLLGCAIAFSGLLTSLMKASLDMKNTDVLLPITISLHPG